MSRRLLGLATAILIALPCAAMADVFQTIPVPASPGTTPQRLSPRQVFRWLDANHDGFLSLNEFLAAPWIQNKRQATRFFRWMDTNHDGLVSLQEFLAAYTRYSGSDGYYIRVAYPWAWTCWRPWRYGWYWQSGWHRRPGVWPGYAVHSHPNVARRHHAITHVGPVRHPHPVKHVKAAKHVKAVKHNPHGNHKGHVQKGRHR
jgi:hypothetical protein